MSLKKYKVGIVGYGFSAKVFHVPFIEVVPELELYAVVQRNPTLGNDAEKDHSEIKCYKSTEEMLENAAVEVIVVTTPPNTHFQIVRSALEKGKHVVVEKPFTPTAAEADELINVAEKNHCLLTIYQNRRWDSDFLTLSDLIEKNVLGRIVEFETHFDRHRLTAAKGSWKTDSIPGGGAVYDLGTHLIDQVVLIFGLPESITAFVGSQRKDNPEGFEDSFTILLHYKGMLATVKAGVVSPEVEQLRYWVRGENGSYKKFHLDCQEEQLKRGKSPEDNDFGDEPKERHGILTTIKDGLPSSTACPNIRPLTYRTFYTQLVKALSGEDKVPVKAQDASAVIRLIELAKKSSKEGKTLRV